MMKSRLAIWGGIMLVLAGWSGKACAVTPKSPEVQEVIDRGVAFLSKSSDGRLGGACLIALCILKNGGDPSHPQVQEAIKQCLAVAEGGGAGGPTGGVDNYSIGIAVMFLCEADPADPLRYRDATEKMLQIMLKKQQAGGGWSYSGMQTGDTSQTQYSALGLWTAKAVGIEVPQERVERLCGWLIRTQDVSGAWGYQGTDPGSYTRVNQSSVRPSLAAAGLGSLYICSDLLGITNPKEEEPDSNVPAALRAVQDKAPKKKKSDGISRVIDAGLARRSMADGNRWIDANLGKYPQQWTYYYLYGLERCMSFRELAEGTKDPEPDWYNDTFEFLRRNQQPNGAWKGADETEVINTCFAVLFLLRSSKKLIDKIKPLGEGTLLGGMGLPSETADLQEKDGKIVESPLAGSVDELLAIIDDPENADMQRLAASGGSLALDSNVTKRAGQITKLRSLVSAGSYEARLVAVQMLGKVREFDNVPVLLYALTDPDVRIVQAADKGLRFVSRKFGGVGLPEEPTATDIKAAQNAWKAWYLSVRPDAELLD
jgi:hypothetical protein